MSRERSPTPTSAWRTRVLQHEVVDSTMALAREHAGAGAHAGTTVVAAAQTAGRGRYGAWQSKPGDGIYLTAIVWPNPVWPASSLSVATALWVAHWCRAQGICCAQVKWPNDVVGAHGKLCGILLEQGAAASGEVFVLVGVGLNVQTPTLVGTASEAGALPPSSLTSEAQAASRASALAPNPLPAANQLTATLLQALGEGYERWQRQGFAPMAADFDAAHAYFGQEVVAQGAGADGGPLMGHVGAIAGDGRLALHVGGVRHLVASARLRLAQQSPSLPPLG